jgi:predicted MFS family arabinose efflux permease
MPLGGVLADNYNRKRILVIGDALACLIVLGLALLIQQLSAATAWLLYPGLFALSCVTSVYYPCFQAVIPMVVAKDQLPQANALMLGTENVIAALGPLAGGFFVAVLGATESAVLNALTFAVSLAFILALRLGVLSGQQAVLTPSAAANQLVSGFREGMSNPIIRYGTVMFIFVNFGSHLIVGNFVYFLANDIGLGPFDVGLTMALTGIGAIAGSALAPALIRRVSSGSLMLGALAVNGAVIPTILLTHNMYAVAASRAVSMAAGAIIMITMFTLRQRAVPPQFLGRTVAITRAISFAPIPVAAVLGGWMIEATGSMTSVVLLSAAVMIGTSLYGLFTPFVEAGRRIQST